MGFELSQPAPFLHTWTPIFIRIDNLTINVQDIITIKENTQAYEMIVRSFHADIRHPSGEPMEFGVVQNDRYFFTKGRPETKALLNWLSQWTLVLAYHEGRDE